VPNPVRTRKVAALWIAILSGSGRHCNRRIGIGESNLVNVNGVYYHIVGRRCWATANVKSKVSCSASKAVYQYQKRSVSVSRESNLTLKAARIVITRNTGKWWCTAIASINRYFGIKISTVTKGQCNCARKAASIGKAVPNSRTGKRGAAVTCYICINRSADCGSSYGIATANGYRATALVVGRRVDTGNVKAKVSGIAAKALHHYIVRRGAIGEESNLALQT